MKKILNYSKYSTLALIFLLTFIKFQFLPFALVLFLFLSLFTIDYKSFRYYKFKTLLPIFIFFTINAFSLIYSKNFKAGFTTVQTQFSLIIFPLLVIFDKDFYLNNKNKITTLFVYVSFISILYLLFIFVREGNLYKTIEISEKYNIFSLLRFFKLSAGQHPSYISIGYLFSIIIIWHSLNKSNKKLLTFIKIIAIIFLFIFVILLNSRAIIISVLVVMIYFLYKYLNEHRLIYKILATIFILISIIFFINETRFKQVFQNLENATSIEQIDLRISLWRNALIVYKEKPLFGYGIGDSKDAIILVHKNRNISEAFEGKLNAHNQYLETAMQTGLLGFISLFLIFAIPLYQSIMKKQELLFLFLIICIINFTFESMFQRITGVVFFAFWYSFLWFVYYKSDSNNPNSSF